jgi:hypothetical protein
MRYSVDSFKIRIPIDQAEEIHPNITAAWHLVNSETGEAIDQDAKSYEHIRNGIKTRFSIEKQITADQSVREFLTFVVTSKTLEGRYLEGLTADTIRQAYNYIQSTGLVNFSFDTFMQSELTDIDVKKDFDNPIGVKIVDRLKAQATPRAEGRAATIFREKFNQGIQFSERKTNRFNTAPYIKVYSKWADLQKNSLDFASSYGINVAPSYWRIETTIKNKKHLKKHDITNSTLQGIVSLPQGKLEEIMTAALKAHLEPMTRQTTKAEGLSPQEVITATMMHLLIGMDWTYEAIERTLLQHLNKSNRAKHRLKFRQIYESQILPTPKGQESDKLNTVFEAIGYNF